VDENGLTDRGKAVMAEIEKAETYRKDFLKRRA